MSIQHIQPPCTTNAEVLIKSFINQDPLIELFIPPPTWEEYQNITHDSHIALFINPPNARWQEEIRLLLSDKKKDGEDLKVLYNEISDLLPHFACAQHTFDFLTRYIEIPQEARTQVLEEAKSILGHTCREHLGILTGIISDLYKATDRRSYLVYIFHTLSNLNSKNPLDAVKRHALLQILINKSDADLETIEQTPYKTKLQLLDTLFNEQNINTLDGFLYKA